MSVVQRVRRMLPECAASVRPRDGQILVMFALMVTVFAGMLGLAIDVGYAYSQRRTVQNAADAAAMAGARMVANWTSANPTSAQTEAQTFATMDTNRIASTNQTLQSCEYVNYAGNSQGACSATVPANATGVRVVVEETHSTWFIQVIPGAADTVTTSAAATAHVEEFNGATAGPIIVCGKSTKLRSGGSFSILDASNQINPAAYNKEYEIHGPGIEDCGAQGNSFKGSAIRSNLNDDKGPGDDWIGDTGNQVGPM